MINDVFCFADSVSRVKETNRHLQNFGWEFLSNAERDEIRNHSGEAGDFSINQEPKQDNPLKDLSDNHWMEFAHENGICLLNLFDPCYNPQITLTCNIIFRF